MAGKGEGSGWLARLLACCLGSHKEEDEDLEKAVGPLRRSNPLDLRSISSVSSISSTVHQIRRLTPPPRESIQRQPDFSYSSDGSAEFRKAMQFLYGQYEVLGEQEASPQQSARYYLERATEAGHPEGTAMYGVCCECGIGGERDGGRASQVYLLAQRRGSLMAHCLLASLTERFPLGTVLTAADASQWKTSCPAPDDAISSLFVLYEAAETYRLPEAMYLLGHLFETGCGVKQDAEMAVEHYRKAATEEHAPACTALGRCYETEVGLTKDLDEAQHWYALAARRGDVDGMTRLARMLEFGRPGVDPDARAAFGWCLQAVQTEPASPLSHYGIARCYELAIGTNLDREQAAEHYETAAKAGYAEAQFALASCFMGGQARPRSSRLSVQWTEAAADGGHIPAMLAMGKFYHDGTSVEQSHERAVRWFRRAALASSSPDAWYELGLCYRDGHGVAADDLEAQRWVGKAARAGHAEAAFDMYLMLFEGTEHIIRSLHEAIRWLLASAEEGYTEAQVTLADYLVDPAASNCMLSRNLLAAHQWYRRAAVAGNAYGQYQLAMQYLRGLPSSESGVRLGERHCPNTAHPDDNSPLAIPVDLRKAAYWLQRSAEQRFDAAEKALPLIRGMLVASSKKTAVDADFDRNEGEPALNTDASLRLEESTVESIK